MNNINNNEVGYLRASYLKFLKEKLLDYQPKINKLFILIYYSLYYINMI